MFTSFDKAIVAVVGMALLVLNSLAAASVGFTPQTQNYISLAIAILTPIAVYLAKNQNQPTLAANQVVVASQDAKPGAPIVAAHKP